MTDLTPAPPVVHDTGRRPRPRAVSYDRSRDLPRLVALWPRELADTTLEGHERLVKVLWRALRIERRLGLAGHFSYDLGRHRALLAATRHEEQALARRRAEAASDR